MKRSKSIHRGDTRMKHPPLTGKLSCEITIAVSRCVASPVEEKNNERKKAVASLLRQETRAAGRLVQTLKTNKPMPQRKYDTRLVACLIYQTENLLSLFERYVSPLLEQRDSNKSSLP